MGKKKGKNILMPPFNLDWPKVDKDTEDKIITALTQKLQEFPRLENKKMKNGREKGEQSTAPLPPPPISSPSASQEEDDSQRKARLRRQVVFGHRQVSKGLGWDQLSLVLVSGDAQPPLLLRSLLPLAANHRCPALCLPSLHPLTHPLGLTSVLALGFKKSQPGESGDFEEVVSLVTSLAPPLTLPCRAHQETSGKKVSKKKASSVGGGRSTAAAKEWRLMETEKEKEMVEKLKEMLKPYESVLQTPRAKMTADQLETRKNINSCLITDVAALTSAALDGLLDLLIVNSEPADPSDPQPRPHPALTSVMQAARVKDCPVLYMTSLRGQLGPLLRDTSLRAMGFKKPPVGKVSRQPQEFRQFVSTAVSGMGSPATESSSAGELGGDSKSAESSTGKKRETQHNKPVYDVSSLYVYKQKDQGETTEENTDTNTAAAASSSSKRRKLNIASEAFISLTSAPTIQYLGVKSLSANNGGGDSDKDNDNSSSSNNKAESSNIGFIDCAGSGLAKKDVAAMPASKKKSKPESEGDAGKDCSKNGNGNSSSGGDGGDGGGGGGGGDDGDGGGGFTGIMGMDVVDTTPARRPYHQPRRPKAKAGLKRAMDSSAERGEFVSFKVAPTNVQLSIPNPNKKRKPNKKSKKK